ncbi:MAG: hypothetical protein IPK83_20635 [Planctomycetes bacterium]|nr:hypothetical protein [Planctomycetota bacterium]
MSGQQVCPGARNIHRLNRISVHLKHGFDFAAQLFIAGAVLIQECRAFGAFQVACLLKQAHHAIELLRVHDDSLGFSPGK